MEDLNHAAPADTTQAGNPPDRQTWVLVNDAGRVIAYMLDYSGKPPWPRGARQGRASRWQRWWWAHPPELGEGLSHDNRPKQKAEMT